MCELGFSECEGRDFAFDLECEDRSFCGSKCQSDGVVLHPSQKEKGGFRGVGVTSRSQ